MAPKHPSFELRAYRFISVVLLTILTSIAAYLADATVTASNELPAIKQQLAILNKNLDEISDLPMQVQANNYEIQNMKNRLANIEARRGS